MSVNEWENRYLAGETPWDKGAASPALAELLEQEPITGRVLVPGCGFGYDVRLIAPTASEVIGIDIAPSAVEAAKQYPNSGKESYVVADLFNLPMEWRGTFDSIWEHTCFCAIQPSLREAYVEAVAGALKPGGQLYAQFYLDPGNTSPDEGPPFEVKIPELDRLFQPKFELVREWLPTRTYPGREGREWMRVLRRR